MNENEELQSGFPDWLTEDYKLMEPVFCRTFLREHPMRCIRGRFYTVDGLVADESVLKKRNLRSDQPVAGNQNRQKGGRASERPADGGVLGADSIGV